MTPTQFRFLTALKDNSYRTDWDGWSFGERRALASLVAKGWAVVASSRMTITKKGAEALAAHLLGGK